MELDEVDLVLERRYLTVIVGVGDLVGVLQLAKIGKTTGCNEVAETKALVV